MVPEGWKASTLGECVSIRSGGTPSKQKPEFWGGKVPWVSAKDLKTHLISDAQDHLTDAGAEQAKMAEPNSVLMLVRGMTLLKDVPIGFVTKPVAFNQDLKALVANGDIDPKFLSYLLVAKKLQMMGLVNTANHGTGRLDTDLLKGLPVDVPPLPEQRKIADILSTWDAAIEKTEALLATAKAQKRALMQSLLTGKRRFPEFEGQPWKEVRFENVFSRVRRKNTVANDNVLTISAQHGLVSQEKYFNKRVAAKDLSGYTLLHYGDFAYNKSYSRGYPLGAIKMLEVDEPGVVSSLYLCFALRDESSNCREYYRHFFEAGRFNHEIYKFAQEGARNHGLLNVSSTDFFCAQINVPPLAEQQKIAVVMKDTEDQIAEHAQSVAKLRTEKKALMQQLLTGKRRVEV
jgi:type I restriction enzyme S subunit